MAPRSRKGRPDPDRDRDPKPNLDKTPRPPAGHNGSGHLDEGDLRRGYARGRARDDAIREGLEPLEPGERPREVTIAAIVAIVLALANGAAALSGNDLTSSSGDPSVTTIVTSALLLFVALGMLAGQYWAVLGFQAMICFQIILFSLALVIAQSIEGAIFPFVGIILFGWLFWKLIRAMARMQARDRRPAEGR